MAGIVRKGSLDGLMHSAALGSKMTVMRWSKCSECYIQRWVSFDMKATFA